MWHMNGWISAMWSLMSSWLLNIFSHPAHLWFSQQWNAQSSFSQSWQGAFLLASAIGDTAREAVELDVRIFSGVAWLLESPEEASWESPCFILLCCLSPFSETDLKSHWSHESTLEVTSTSSVWFTVEGLCLCCKYSSLRLAFLLRVEGLAFFLVFWLPSFLLVSKVKVKSEPMIKDKLKAWPWLASAWQKSMHLEAREVSISTTALILALLLNLENLWASVKHVAEV